MLVVLVILDVADVEEVVAVFAFVTWLLFVAAEFFATEVDVLATMVS